MAAVLVISNEPVNLYKFAAYFCDELTCDDAFHLNGPIIGVLD